ncbi:MAG TPA: hypothetical protein PKE40_00430 [Arachnia sp.]|nr:hypothetical protein [Arachnia sp.]HMT84791.1 hypothetical protein [Arachnia sp.]
MSERNTPYDEDDFWAADGIARPDPVRRDDEAVTAAAGDEEPTSVIAGPTVASNAGAEAGDPTETKVLFESIFVDDAPARPSAPRAGGLSFADRVFGEGIDLAPVVTRGFQDTPFSDSLWRLGIELSAVAEPKRDPEPEETRPWYKRWVSWVIVGAVALLLFTAVVWATRPPEEPQPTPEPTAQPTEPPEASPEPTPPPTEEETPEATPTEEETPEATPTAEPTPDPTPTPTAEPTAEPDEDGSGWTWPWEGDGWTWPWDGDDGWTWPWQGDDDPGADPSPEPDETESAEPDDGDGWTWPWDRDDWEWPWDREDFRWPWQGDGE